MVPGRQHRMFGMDKDEETQVAKGDLALNIDPVTTSIHHDEYATQEMIKL